MRAWRWAGVSLTFGLAVLSLPFAAAPAPPPSLTKYTFTSGERSYKVPRGVTMLGVEAIGGFGSPNPTTSNNGMDLGVALPVTAGKILFVEVGAGATGAASGGGGGGAGGAGDAAGGAGGGASDVRTCSMKAASCPGGGTSLASRLVVAGGGGGSGGQENVSHLWGNSCGGNEAGGNAWDGSSAPVKVAAGTVILGQPGLSTQGPPGGGSATGPGAGGFTSPCWGGTAHNFGAAVAGSRAVGPNGGGGGASGAAPTPGGGGGGGGGYFGGGGGSSGQADLASSACPGGGCSASDGSGGGGGSSFYVSQTTGNTFHQSAAGQQPSVTLTPLIKVDSPAGGAVFARGKVVKASYSCLDTCSGTVPAGSKIDTSTVGSHSFQVVDRYLSHTPAVSTVHYTVVASKH